MLLFKLWPDGGGFSDHADGWSALWANPVVREKIAQVLSVAESLVGHVPVRLDGLDSVPLWVRYRYAREELLAAVGRAVLGCPPVNDREGVRCSEPVRADVVTFALTRSERDARRRPGTATTPSARS